MQIIAIYDRFLYLCCVTTLLTDVSILRRRLVLEDPAWGPASGKTPEEVLVEARQRFDVGAQVSPVASDSIFLLGAMAFLAVVLEIYRQFQQTMLLYCPTCSLCCMQLQEEALFPLPNVTRNLGRWCIFNCFDAGRIDCFIDIDRRSLFLVF